jgi:hypothetical protein
MTHAATGASIAAPNVAVFGQADESDTIDLRQGVAIYEGASGTSGGIVANAGAGIVVMGPSASSGDVWSIGNVTLEARTIVHGTLRTSGTADASASQITGQRFEQTPIQRGLTVVRATFPVPPPPDVAQNTSLTLAPGSYGNFIMNGGTLTLQAGTYTFESLLLNTGTGFQLHPAHPGLVFVYVKNFFVFRANTVSFDPAKLRFAVFGTRTTFIEGNTSTPFLGTVVAMNSLVAVQSGRPCRGALFGLSIRIEPNASVRHVAFASWEPPS